MATPASPTSSCRTGKSPCCCATSRPKHLQEKWFKRLVEDPKFLLAHCLTEPSGASDRWLPYDVPEAAMRTRAVRTKGGWIVNGRKQFVLGTTPPYVVYATSEPGVGMTKGSSSFLVPRDTKGLTIARCNETLGCRFMNNGELVFEDMFVPEDHLLVEGNSLAKAGVYSRPGKIIQPRRSLGVGVRCIEVAQDYVQNYVQGGGEDPDQASGSRGAPRRHDRAC